MNMQRLKFRLIGILMITSVAAMAVAVATLIVEFPQTALATMVIGGIMLFTITIGVNIGDRIYFGDDHGSDHFG